MIKVVKQSHDIWGECPSTMAESLRWIEAAGRVCYQSQDKITEDSYLKFVKMLAERGHWAMLEHSNLVLNTSVRQRMLEDSNFIRKGGERGNYIYAGNLRAYMEALESIDPLELYSILEKNLMPLAAQPLWAKAVTVKFTTNRAMCYDEHTEVLTKEGWKLFKDLTKEDEFLSYDRPGYDKASALHQYDYRGELITGKSSMVDFAVTPNHRMLWQHYDSRQPSWKVNEASEVTGRRVKFLRGLPYEWEGVQPEENFPGQCTDEFAKFMGVFITDGSINVRKYGAAGNGGAVFLSQTKPSGRAYIKEVLTALGWRYSTHGWGFSIHDSKLHAFLLTQFPKTELRRKMSCRVPEWIRSAGRSYIRSFLEGVLVGDGSVHLDNRHSVIYTSNKELAGDYQECILKAGKCSSVRTVDRRGSTHLINGKESMKVNMEYIISITDRTNEHLFNKQHWGTVSYEGKVYCVSVPSGMLYVRRNGKCLWSGNSHELVRHRPCSFAQLSQRYVDHRQTMEFIFPQRFQGRENSMQYDQWYRSMEQAAENYVCLREYGESPQEARDVLPNSKSTEIVITADLMEWKHIFGLRCAPAADPMMQDLMIPTCRDFELNGWTV